eukprot:gene17309-biopygen13220
MLPPSFLSCTAATLIGAERRQAPNMFLAPGDAIDRRRSESTLRPPRSSSAARRPSPPAPTAKLRAAWGRGRGGCPCRADRLIGPPKYKAHEPMCELRLRAPEAELSCVRQPKGARQEL